MKTKDKRDLNRARLDAKLKHNDAWIEAVKRSRQNVQGGSWKPR